MNIWKTGNRTFMAFLLCAICIHITACSSDPTSPRMGPPGRLYVLNQNDSTIYVYDTQDLSRVDSIRSPAGAPHYIEFAPDGLNYYITTFETPGQLARYSTAAGFSSSVVMPPAVRPTAVAITSDNQFGYICNFSSPGARTDINKYDLGTMQWVAQFGAGAFTHDIKITSDGKVVVACNQYTDDLTLIYPDADSVAFVAMSPAGPSIPGQHVYGPLGVAIDHKDSLAFIACMNGNQVRWLDIEARVIADSIDIPVDTTGTANSVAGPTLMAVSPDNDVVFVTTQAGRSVVAFRVSTKQILADIPLSTTGPFGITMSDDGSEVYVACTNTSLAQGRVYVIDGITYGKIDSIDVGRNSFGLTWRAAP